MRLCIACGTAFKGRPEGRFCSKHCANSRPRLGGPLARFMRKVQEQPNGCWLWTGYLSEDGYGIFKLPSGAVKAHRWSFERQVGPIASGLELDHVCRNRACVNPAHLEPVTHQQNMERGVYFNSSKTACLRGHPFDEQNTGYSSSGKRYCKECSRAHNREYARQRRARAKAGAPCA